MADANKLAALLKGLADEGFQMGDIMKALKSAKESGVIKSKGRGKAPQDDPLRLAIRDALLGLNVSNGKDVNGDLVALISGATSDSVSFMVTLNDNWKVNFIKNIPHDKKDKEEKKEKGPESFEEPAVA